MNARLATFLVRHAVWVLIAMALVTAVALVFASGIRIDFTPQALYAHDNPEVLFAEAHKQTFGYEESILLVALVAEGDDDVLSAPALTWQAEIADDLSKMDVVESVTAIPYLRSARYTLTRPPFFIEQSRLVAHLPVDQAAAERVRHVIDGQPLVNRTMISEDRRLGAVIARLAPDDRGIDGMQAMVNAVRKAVAQRPPPSGFSSHLGGLPMLRVDIVENLERDQMFFVPLAGGAFLIVLTLLFRRACGIFLPILAVALGLIWAAAVLEAMGQTLNIFSNALPTLIMVIGVSNCVHILCRYAEESHETTNTRSETVVSSMTHMLFACALTFATTGVGFASLMLARSDVMQNFGWQSALGMLALFFSVTITFGTLLKYLEAPAKNFRNRPTSPLGWMLSHVGSWVTSHPKSVLLTSMLIVGVCLFSARNVEVESTVIETYDEQHPTIQRIRLHERQLAGLLALEVNLQADDPDRFLDPAVYLAVNRFAKEALKYPEVIFSRSYVDLYQEAYAQFPPNSRNRTKLPTNDEAGRKQIRSMQGKAETLDKVLHPETFITPDRHQARILLRVKDAGIKRTLALIGELDKQLAHDFPSDSGVKVRMTGDAWLYAMTMDGLVRDLFNSLLAASAVIFLIISLLFRSPRLGLVAAIPNLTPLAVTLGYMGLRGFDMNCSNGVVFVVSLGIAVDDTIHFLARFLEEFKVDGQVRPAVRRAVDGTGRAIILTSLLIFLGLSVLLTSDFVPTRRFAELTGITLAGALLGDLLLLPACLVLFVPDRKMSGSQAVEVAVPEERAIAES